MTRVLAVTCLFAIGCSYSDPKITDPSFITGDFTVDRTTNVVVMADEVTISIRVFDTKARPLAGRRTRVLVDGQVDAAAATEPTNNEGATSGSLSSSSVGDKVVTVEVATPDGWQPLPGATTVSFVTATSPSEMVFRTKTEITVAASPIDLLSVDVNGDGIRDLLTLNGAAESITVVHGSLEGLSVAREIEISPLPRQFALLDREHVGVAYPSSDTVEVVHLGDGQATVFSVDDGPSAIVGASFLSAQSADLAVASANRGTVTVLASGTTAAAPLEVGLTPVALAAGDFDGDQDVDLAVANAATQKLTLLLNESGTLVPTSSTSLAHIPTAITGARFDAAAAGVGVAVVSQSGNTLSRFDYDSETKSFVLTQTLGVSGGPKDVVAADFDRNKVDELVLARATEVSLASRGDTGYALTPITLACDGPVALTVADFNFDGLFDIAAANLDAGTLSVFYAE